MFTITCVEIKLAEDGGTRRDGSGVRCVGFATVEIDRCFVIRDLKIIDKGHGYLVSMPSRKTMYHCPTCRSKNHTRANYCNECGYRLPVHEMRESGKQYLDVAHPIDSRCRGYFVRQVMDAYHREVALQAQRV